MPTGTSGPFQAVNMPAIDLRRLVGAGIVAEGAQGATDLAAGQRGAGANMSVDIAPGWGYIKDDHGSGDGFYFVRVATTENVAVTASDPSNPRIDRVGIRVKDTNLGDAADSWTLEVLAGTATAGANLMNLTNAAAVPSNFLLLGNILVGAAATSITTANIDTTQNARPRMRAPTDTELDYVQITASPAGVTATTEGTATTVITGTTRPYDGGKVDIRVFFPKTSGGTTPVMIVKRGATVLGQIPFVAGTSPLFFTIQDTPSASSFAYTVAAFVSSGTLTLTAGAGLTGANFPAYIRVSRAT